MARKVFVISDSGHDFTDATRFGELVIMSKGLVSKFHVTAVRRLFEPFIDSSTESDFLLCSGPSLMTAIACSMFAARHGCLNLLLFHGTGESHNYVQRRIRFDSQREKETVIEPAS